MSNGTHGVEYVKMKKKKRKKPMTRSWVDLCSNDVTLDGFTVKERVSVSTSLGYTMTAISKYFTLEEMTKKDRCVVDGFLEDRTWFLFFFLYFLLGCAPSQSLLSSRYVVVYFQSMTE